MAGQSVVRDASGLLYHPLYGYHGVSWIYRGELGPMFIPECFDGAIYYCLARGDTSATTPPASTGTPGASATPPPPPTADELRSAVITQLLLQLSVPRPELRIGPDPSVNEWNMAVVGYPLWLWTAEPGTRSATLTALGQTFTLNATRGPVTFSMGDGSAPFTCAAMTPYPGVSVGDAPSPTCGYTYKKPSGVGGTYRVTATAQWSVAWSAMGYSGVINLPLTASRQLKVGELQALVER